MADKKQIQSMILSVTEKARPPLVPELEMVLVTPRSPWWTKTPEELEAQGIPEPFWGFAWGGGQCLARYILDHPDAVTGRRVLDFGAGGGIVGLAALKAGAASVLATEIDPWAMVAMAMNFEEGDERVSLSQEDWIGVDLPPGTVLLCGDMTYEKALTERMHGWFAGLSGVRILVGDPGRGFLDQAAFKQLEEYRVPTDNDSEGVYFSLGGVFEFVF